MKVGHLRKLLASYSDDCELLVEMVLPGEPAKTSDDHWHTRGREPGTCLVRGETIPNGYTHCGGSEGPLRPTTAIIEVAFQPLRRDGDTQGLTTPMTAKSLTKSERERLVGKLVRIWRSKKRDVGEIIEGVVEEHWGGVLAFPVDAHSRWVVTATRTLDVFEDGQWVPVFPR